MSTELKLEIIASAPILAPGDFDLTPNNPNLAAELLGRWLTFAASVEQEVPDTARLARLLTPNANDTLREFQQHWEAQETGHGKILGALAAKLDIACMPLFDKSTAKMRMLGKLASRADKVANLTELIYLTYGAIAEDETMRSYRFNAEKLKRAGEPGIARALSEIAAQEALHRGYYIDAVEERRENTLLRNSVRIVIERLYTPVGIVSGNDNRMELFGHAILGTTGHDFTVLTAKAERLAFNLVGARPGFLDKTYSRCLALALD